MTPTLYDQLRVMTVVVADTGDINSIRQFKPRDATTNPSLITAAAQMEEYRDVVDSALNQSRKEMGSNNQHVVKRAIDRLAVEFGRRVLDIVEGRVSTEVDARLSFDEEGTVAKAHELIGFYEKAGVSRERVLIKNRVDLGGNLRGPEAAAGGHSLQPDAALRPSPGDRLCRSGRHPDLTFCWPNPGLAQKRDRTR